MSAGSMRRLPVKGGCSLSTDRGADDPSCVQIAVSSLAFREPKYDAVRNLSRASNVLKQPTILPAWLVAGWLSARRSADAAYGAKLVNGLKHRQQIEVKAAQIERGARPVFEVGRLILVGWACGGTFASGTPDGKSVK
jgi:hypothetical protein